MVEPCVERLAGLPGCPVAAQSWLGRPGEGWAEGPSRRDAPAPFRRAAQPGQSRSGAALTGPAGRQRPAIARRPRDCLESRLPAAEAHPSLDGGGDVVESSCYALKVAVID